jgi:hypothetical protein
VVVGGALRLDRREAWLLERERSLGAVDAHGQIDRRILVNRHQQCMTIAFERLRDCGLDLLGPS